MNTKKVFFYILISSVGFNNLFAKEKEEEIKPVSQFGNCLLAAGSACSAFYFTYKIVKSIKDKDADDLKTANQLVKLTARSFAIYALINIAYQASLKTPAKSTVQKISNATKANLKKLTSYFYCE